MYKKKNHPAMKTVVETFVIEETQELIYDNEKLDKWNKYVEELGLTGQTKIITPTANKFKSIGLMKINSDNIV